MDTCKFCGAELEEKVTLCPACGKDNAEAAVETPETEKNDLPETGEQAADTAPAQTEETAPAQTVENAPEKPKATPGKIAMAVVAIVVLAALLAGLILTGLKQSQPETQPDGATAAVTEPAPTVPATVPADGDPENVTCKGTYTASEADLIAGKDTVVATMGDKTLTNSQLQVYYWLCYYNFMNQNYSYAPYFGLDYTAPLDVQLMSRDLHHEEFDMTWQQYFLQMGLDTWQQYQAMAIEAEKAGISMRPESQAALDGLEAEMTAGVAEYGVTVEEYFHRNFGPAAGLEEYSHYWQIAYQGEPYYTAESEKLVPTEQELEEYFTARESEYAASGVSRDTRLVDVRHILLTPQGGTADESGNVTYSDAEWQACENAAQAVLDQWLAGEQTEDSFAALANEHSTDPGSNTAGGLYEGVYEGQMVDTFNDWCFDASRQTGDTGLVKTTYGYHVMYFVDSQGDIWKQYAESDWIAEQSNLFLTRMLEKHPMEVEYEKILLGLPVEE